MIGGGQQPSQKVVGLGEDGHLLFDHAQLNAVSVDFSAPRFPRAYGAVPEGGNRPLQTSPRVQSGAARPFQRDQRPEDSAPRGVDEESGDTQTRKPT